MRAHGTTARYRHGPDQENRSGRGCRCRPCKDAANRAVTLRRLAMAQGTHQPMVDAGPVRDHVTSLHAAGLPYLMIARLAGVQPVVVNRLIYGSPASRELPTQRMLPQNADALLAVQPNQVADEGFTLAVGSRRRLQALAWAGWPAPYIAPRIPTHPDYVRCLTAGQRGAGTVTADMARRVKAVFSDLWMESPVSCGVPAAKSSQVRTLAARKGWVSALAWGDIDDPDAVPDLGETSSRAAALLEDSEELLRLGHDMETVAQRLGTNREALAKARRRAKQRVAS